MIVETTPVSVDLVNSQYPLIQNLGSGDVYLGNTSAVTTATGLKLPQGLVVELPQIAKRGQRLWLVSDTSADVRVLAVP